MKYIKVLWIHNFPEEPVEFYHELDENHFEVRKIEIFNNGSLDYAHFKGRSGATRLSEEPIPPIEEIASDPQFQVYKISSAEFEDLWERALLPS